MTNKYNKYPAKKKISTIKNLYSDRTLYPDGYRLPLSLPEKWTTSSLVRLSPKLLSQPSAAGYSIDYVPVAK